MKKFQFRKKVEHPKLSSLFEKKWLKYFDKNKFIAELKVCSDLIQKMHHSLFNDKSHLLLSVDTFSFKEVVEISWDKHV